MTEAVAPEMALGKPFCDVGQADAKGIKCYTELWREEVQSIDRAVYEGLAHDRAHFIHMAVSDYLDRMVPKLADGGESDARQRLSRMHRRSQFMIDRDGDLERLAPSLDAAYTKLLRRCDHKMLAEQIIALWEDAQAQHDYWREQITAVFKTSPVLSGSVAVLHRAGVALPSDLITHVLGGPTV